MVLPTRVYTVAAFATYYTVNYVFLETMSTIETTVSLRTNRKGTVTTCKNLTKGHIFVGETSIEAYFPKVTG